MAVVIIFLFWGLEIRPFFNVYFITITVFCSYYYYVFLFLLL